MPIGLVAGALASRHPPVQRDGAPTQANLGITPVGLIARRSGGSELYGAVRVACEGLGLGSIFHDLGTTVDVKVLIDANAAKRIIERRGLCKVRHLDTEHLWLQQQPARRLLPLGKIAETLNPADLLTHNLPEKDVAKYMKLLDLAWFDGLSKAAAQLHNTNNKGHLSGGSWSHSSKTAAWKRLHSTWRWLFTPMRARGVPANGKHLSGRRVAQGVRRDGSSFKIEDTWKNNGSAHRMLPFDWRGSTTLFHEFRCDGDIQWVNGTGADGDSVREDLPPQNRPTPTDDVGSKVEAGCVGRELSKTTTAAANLGQCNAEKQIGVVGCMSQPPGLDVDAANGGLSEGDMAKKNCAKSEGEFKDSII